MASITATFETGTNGNTIATSDTGSATAWDTVNIGTNTTIVYDTTHTYDTLAAKLTTGATSTGVDLRWSTAFGTQTDHYGRVYVYFTANPGTTMGLITPRVGAGSPAAVIRIDTAGKVLLVDSGGATQATSTNAISLNQWVRLEFHCVHSTTAGSIECKIFNSPDSATATETLTTASNINTGVSATSIRFGLNTNVANFGPFWMDNIVATATSYPGPAGATATVKPLAALGVG